MESAYEALGKPGIFRNDRFWLAGDHVVDPRIKDIPQVKALVKSSENARQQFKMTEYQGMNVCCFPDSPYSPCLRFIGLVYNHAHRVLSRTSTARYAGHWL